MRTISRVDSSVFKAACASGQEWRTIANQCLEELGPIPASANLGLLYVTDALAPRLGDLLEYVRSETGIATWVGTVGTGICFTGREVYDEPAAAIMLAKLPEDSFRIIPAGDERLSEMLSTNESWIRENGAHFAIVHGDPRNGHITESIESLWEELNPGFLVGGLSSASDASNQVQIAGEPCEGGLSGVLLSSKIPVVTGLTQGCTPLAGRHKITRCDRNILIELDDQPALDVFREDIGEALSNDLSRVAGYVFANTQL